MFEVVEWHELNNVSQDRFSFRRAEYSIIPIQHLHVAEIRVAHADDDDRHGQVGGVDDGLSCVCHICDHSICQDQQYKIFLMAERNKWENI